MGVRTEVERRPVAGRMAADMGWAIRQGRRLGGKEKTGEREKRKRGRWVWASPNRSNTHISTHSKIKHPEKIIPE